MKEEEYIKKAISQSIEASKIEVVDLKGDRNHWGILVVSRSFQGKSLLEQHRMVHECLKDDIGDSIHAVQIKTIIEE